MASIINASPTNGIVQTADGSGVLKIQSNSVTTNALAWVNFNGTGTVAIRSSYNVSSITDNGTGDYTVNFATALADANYCIATSGAPISGEIICLGLDYTTPTKTTTAVRLNTKAPGAAKTDSSECNVAIFGN